MKLDQRDFLLISEGIQCAGRKAGEGVIGGREYCDSAVRIVELIVDLISYLRALHQPYQCVELPSFLQHSGDVQWARRRRSSGGLCVDSGGGVEEEEEGDGEEGEAVHGLRWQDRALSCSLSSCCMFWLGNLRRFLMEVEEGGGWRSGSQHQTAIIGCS